MSIAALRSRMAEVYGVPDACVLPVRGRMHGLQVVARRAALHGRANIVAREHQEAERIARLERLALAPTPDAGTGAVLLSSPSPRDGRVLGADMLPAPSGDALVVVDEQWIEFSSGESLVAMAVQRSDVIVLRDVESAFGFAGSPCAALIASPDTIGRLAEALDPEPMAAAVVSAALNALAPQRMSGHARRRAAAREERERVRQALVDVVGARAADGPFVFVTVRDRGAINRAVAAYAVSGAWVDDETFRIDVGSLEENDRAIAAFGGAAPSRSHRRAEVVRETAETRIGVSVDLDAEGKSAIDTGVGFFDHMLSQVATHGGFSLTLDCEGDLEVDAHHTIEDCALALGQALKEALGDKRGIARFGFTLPMDEAQASVAVDLGGRPYLVFEGTFTAPLIGAYATEMTEHVFRSLAQNMGAAIHVSVKGENDHHKTEACFKAFGRALRQAIRIEGDVLPSTKGVI